MIRDVILNKNAFSLLEVLLAAVIFVVSVAGIFTTLNTVRIPVINKENALAAAVFGKQVTEALYSQVSANLASNYNTCTLDANNNCPDFSLYPANHIVDSTTLQVVLSWPNALKSVNNSGCGRPPCLVYNVTCTDAAQSQGAACTAQTGTARQISLSINWPSLP